MKHDSYMGKRYKALRLFIIISLSLISLNLTVLVPSTSIAEAKPSTTQELIPYNDRILVAQKQIAVTDNRVEHTNSNTMLHMALSLKESNPAAETEFIREISDPKSPNYRQYLTPAQFAARFGPSATARATALAYLQSKGFHVTTNDPHGTVIVFSGTAAQAEAAFNVTINDYKDEKTNRIYYSSDKTAAFPLALSSYINGMVGLTNAIVANHSPKTRQIARTQSKQELYGVPFLPIELRTAYNINNLTNAGYDGSGQKVALYELEGYNPDNIKYYDNYFGLDSPTPINKLGTGATAFVNYGDEGEEEAELDIETINAMAPKAQVYVYIGNLTFGLASDLETFQNIATDDQGQVVSISYAYPEDIMNRFDPNFIPAVDQITRQYAAQGQTVFSGAGDRHSYFYDGSNNYHGYSSFPASDPYVLGVGGTSLYTNGLYTEATYNTEVVWNGSYYGGATGGGLSTIFKKDQTRWQVGPGTDVNANPGSLSAPRGRYNPSGARQVPDVAADADPDTGIYAYISVTDGNGNVFSDFFAGGGTSLSSPLWAGFAAITNQYAEAHGKNRIGFASPTLYSILNDPAKYSNDFHDVTLGTNDPYCPSPVPPDFSITPCSSKLPYATAVFYSSTVGYDLATGIGTPNVGNLVPDLSGVSASPEFLVAATQVSLGAGGQTPFPSQKKIDVTALNAAAFYTTSVVYTPSVATKWLEISPTSGEVEADKTASLTLEADRHALASGHYTATVFFYNSDSLGKPTEVDVGFEVDQALSISPTEVNLYAFTGSPDTSSAKLVLKSKDATPRSFTFGYLENDFYAWLCGATNDQNFSCGTNGNGSIASSSSPATLTLSAFTKGYCISLGCVSAVPPGHYTAKVLAIDNSDPLDRVIVKVNLFVLPGVIIAPSSLNFTATTGKGISSPPTQTVRIGFFSPITATNALTYTVAVTYTNGSSGWLNVTPLSGVIPNGSINTLKIGVTLNPMGQAALSPGVYSGTIVITATATNETFNIPVTLTVKGLHQSLTMKYLSG